MDFKKITEEDSLHDHLEENSVIEILNKINLEDQKVASAVKQVIEPIKNLVNQ